MTWDGVHWPMSQVGDACRPYGSRIQRDFADMQIAVDFWHKKPWARRPPYQQATNHVALLRHLDDA